MNRQATARFYRLLSLLYNGAILFCVILLVSFAAYVSGCRLISIEERIRNSIPAQFKLGKTLRLATDCSGFAAVFELLDTPKMGKVEFDQTRELLATLDSVRWKRTDERQLKLNQKQFIAYENHSLSDMISSLKGLDDYAGIIVDMIGDGIGCWESYDKSKNTTMENFFKDLIGKTYPIIMLIMSENWRPIIAIHYQHRLVVFGWI